MSLKFIQSIKTNSEYKNLFKIEIADGDQSIYIRILTAKDENIYSVSEVDIPTSSTNEQQIYVPPGKKNDIKIDKNYYLKLSYHWSGKVHLQKYHNNRSRRSYISQDIAAIDISKLKGEDTFHIASIVVNNLNFFPNNNNEADCNVLDLTSSSDDKFVLAIYATKSNFADLKFGRGIDIINGVVINDPEKEKNDPNNTIYYYFIVRQIKEDVKKNDINISLGWNENIEDISKENKCFFISNV